MTGPSLGGGEASFFVELYRIRTCARCARPIPAGTPMVHGLPRGPLKTYLHLGCAEPAVVHQLPEGATP